MIKGIGIDAVELPRMKELIEKTSVYNAYFNREGSKIICTLAAETSGRVPWRALCLQRSVLSLGTGIGKVSFHDIEVLTNEFGAPIVTKAPHPLEKRLSVSPIQMILLLHKLF